MDLERFVNSGNLIKDKKNRMKSSQVEQENLKKRNEMIKNG